MASRPSGVRPFDAESLACWFLASVILYFGVLTLRMVTVGVVYYIAKVRKFFVLVVFSGLFRFVFGISFFQNGYSTFPRCPRAYRCNINVGLYDRIV